MDAPDAPFDVETVATGPGADGPRIEVTKELSTPCVEPSFVKRMAAGELSTEEIRGAGRQLVRHLLRGCFDCAVAFRQAAGMSPVTRKLPNFYYEVAVDHGIRRRLEDWQGLGEGGRKRSVKIIERERAEALIAEAKKLRRDDPETGIAILDEALRRAKLAEARYVEGELRPRDLACEIHAERANFLRLLGRHPEAEVAFEAALGSWREAAGAGDSLLNLGDLYGSFLIARRRFDEAEILLTRLIGTLVKRGNVAKAGKLAVQRALAAVYAGDPGRALGLVYESLRLLKGTDTLELQLNAAQHIVGLNILLGNFQDASDCADGIRGEYHRHMGASDWVKFLWFDAQIYSGLGRHNIAEGLFRRVKKKFELLGLPFQSALVGLDLAVTLVHCRRPAEARALIAQELIPTFRAVGVAREGLASLVLLERATEAAALDAALLKSVLRDLERAGQEMGPKRGNDEDEEAPAPA